MDDNNHNVFGPFGNDFSDFDYYPNCLDDSQWELEETRPPTPLATPENAPQLQQLPGSHTIASIYFENTQLMKAFIRENKAILKEWVIVLPIQFIGRVRYDPRSKPCFGYLVHESLINIPKNYFYLCLVDIVVAILQEGQ